MPTTFQFHEKSGDDEYIIDTQKQADLGDILDANGNELLEWDTIASAVNFFRLANSATGNAVYFSAQGDDTNVGMDVSSKGTGSVTLWTGDKAREALICVDTASAVNEVTITPAATTAAPKIAASGETNVGLDLSSKGTGSITLWTGNGAREVLIGVDTASAVNEVTITPAATTAAPKIAASGETNVGLDVSSKGTGAITLWTGNGAREVLIGVDTASAVNEITITPAATTAAPKIAASGETNVGLDLSSKGTGSIKLWTGNGAREVLIGVDTASAVNEVTITPAATGAAPDIAASGGDTNVSLRLSGKGSGVIGTTNPFVEEMTQTALTDTATVTIAQLLTKVLDGTPTAAATYTLPTAANLVAGIINARVGDSFYFVVNNKSGGANTITVAGGTGGTSDGTLTVAQNVIRQFLIIVTNVTGASEAYFVYGIE